MHLGRVVRVTVGLLLFVLSMISCDSPRTASRDACEALADEWSAVTNGLLACQVASDCIAVGGPRLPCSCNPSLGSCGRGVNRDAYLASRAPAIAEDFHGRGCEWPATCDCAWGGEVECSAGTCVKAYAFCNAPPPDAPAEVGADAMPEDASRDGP